MKIASTLPVKAAIAAASITTIGVIAFARFDTVDYVRVDQPTYTCRMPPAKPAPPPIAIQIEPAQPLPVIST